MLQNQTGNKPSQVFRQKIWAGEKGISIIEILVVIAILGVVLTSLLGLVSFSLKGSNLIKQNHQANNFAQEIIEVVRKEIYRTFKIYIIISRYISVYIHIIFWNTMGFVGFMGF